jgi:hypothetical protein
MGPYMGSSLDLHDLLDAFKCAEAGFKAQTQRQATQPGRWKKKSGQGNNDKNNKKNKKYKNKKRSRGGGDVINHLRHSK